MMRRILTVNDDRTVLDTLDVLLPQEGYQFAHCASTQNAPDAIAQHKPDLILLDCMFGVEARTYALLHEIKHNPATATIPVVLCSTSKKANEDAAELAHTSNVALLYKPYSLCELLSVIRTALA